MNGKRTLLRSNHFRPAAQPRVILKASAVQPSRGHAPWGSEKRKKEINAELKLKEVEDAIVACFRRQPAPKETIVRAVATEASDVNRSSPAILRFPRVIVTYCAMQLGYRDRYVVQEFVYLRLKQMVSEHREKLKTATQLEQAVRPKPVTVLRAQVSEKLRINRADLERMAEKVFEEIERNILGMVQHGRRIKRELPRGHIAIKATVGQKTARPCFLIVKPDTTSEQPIVLALKTAGEFNRGMRRRFTAAERKRTYAQRPRALRKK